MRIIRKNLSEEVVVLLKTVTKELGVEDFGFVADIFCLFRSKGNGMPSSDRVEALIEAIADESNGKMSRISVKILINKRVQVLKSIVATTYFQSLTLSSVSPISATERLLLNLRKMYRKTRASQCVACPLRANCQFGQQYADAHNITYAVDPDWKAKVDPGCPVLPQIDFANQMAAGANTLNSITQSQLPAAEEVSSAAEGMPSIEFEEDTEEEEDLSFEDDPDRSNADDDYFGQTGAGKKHTDTSRFMGNSVWELNEKLIEQVSAKDLILFELGRKLELELTSKKKGKFSPVNELNKNSDKTNIQSLADLPKVEASQHALPEQLFEAKAQKKTLTKVQNLKPQQKKQLLYILLDLSGSMDRPIGRGQGVLGLSSKSQLAVLLCNAFLRRVKADKGIAYLRPFTGSPGKLTRAETPEEFDSMINQISLANFDGCSTQTMDAIRVAHADITQVQHELAKAALLVVTDCDDHLDEKELRSWFTGNLELSVLDVSGTSTRRFGDASEIFKRVAKRYYKTSEKAVDLTKLVELL